MIISNQESLKNEEDFKIYEKSDTFEYLLYHKDCRAMVGKANIINRFDDWEVICHHCKKIMPVNQIKFVKVKKNAERERERE